MRTLHRRSLTFAVIGTNKIAWIAVSDICRMQNADCQLPPKTSKNCQEPPAYYKNNAFFDLINFYLNKQGVSHVPLVLLLSDCLLVQTVREI